MNLVLNSSIEEARDMIIEISNQYGIEPYAVEFSGKNNYIDIYYDKDVNMEKSKIYDKIHSMYSKYVSNLDLEDIKKSAKKINPKCRFNNPNYEKVFWISIPFAGSIFEL